MSLKELEEIKKYEPPGPEAKRTAKEVRANDDNIESEINKTIAYLLGCALTVLLVYTFA